MKRLIFTLSVQVLGFVLVAQEPTNYTSGKVSFVSSQNIYVKFKSTNGIKVGDTLFLSENNNLRPVLVVKNLSSTSCVCNAISNLPLPVDHLIISKAKPKEAKDDEIVDSKLKDTIQVVVEDTVQNDKPISSETVQKVRGNFSINSYSDFSNLNAENSQKFRYTLSLDVQNISSSKFSVESYISFKHKQGEWSEVKENVFNALKIYNLAVKYDINKTTNISFGRRINQKVPSIGATDGLQVEKLINNFYMGALVGSRPDYSSYGFNPKLIQFGAYGTYRTNTLKRYSESSLAMVQQMNNSRIDRRFLYLQHSNSFIKNLNIFGTFEVDLYKLKVDSLNNATSQNTFNPVGFYLSINYRVTKKINVSGSYDARKNVIYYETYKTYIDHALEDQLRQGFRLQANYRITTNLNFGIQTGYRFLKSDPHTSKNIYSYINYNNIPFLKVSVTLSGTYLESNYMNGQIYGGSVSKDFYQGKIQTNLGYRFIDYKLPESYLSFTQHIGEISFSWLVHKNIFLSINYEGTFENQDVYSRLYLQIRKRF